MILVHFRSPGDLVRYSTVSKSWAAAMRPTTIQLHCLHPSSSVSDVVVRKIRWLQAWHKQGRLQQVTELDMDEKVPLTDRMQITQFSGSIITYAGLWNLQSCSLAGPFCIRLAADILPSSLQELSLRPQQGPVHLPLSAFQRFTHLQSLKLAYRAFYKMGAAAVQEDMLHPAIFVFNQCFMGSLRTLDLLSLSHSSDDIDLRCCTTEDFSVDKCLPNLTSLIAGIYYQPKASASMPGAPLQVNQACSISNLKS